MRKILLCGLLISAFLTGCGSKSGEDSKKLVIWAFTDEFKKPIERFKKRHPGVEVEFLIIPSEEYLNKIRPVLRSGKNAPDVFTAEMDSVKDLVESGYWDDLSTNPYNADVSNLVKYQVDMGTDSKGKLRAISWQTTPGGFYFRRSMAKKYLGTDDPKKVGQMISTPEKFFNVGRLLKKKSNGKIKLIGSYADYVWYPLTARKDPFVKNGRFLIDQKVKDYFDIAKMLREEKLTAEAKQWSPAWFDQMKKDGNTFGYILPTWGLHYVLKAKAPSASGDFAVTKGPGSYFWGGTWAGVYSKSNKKDLAWEFVKMMTLDDDTLKWWAKTTGDFIGNKKVFNEIKDDFSEKYLGGQNHYKFFAQEVQTCDASLITKYDQNIRNMMMQAISDYIEGKKSKAKTLEGLKEQVKNAYPELKVN
jgi:ABC-type glycerol-3-phosphate transport system substrate-binding protein